MAKDKGLASEAAVAITGADMALVGIAHLPTSVRAGAAAIFLGLWPLALFAPLRWLGRISEATYLRAGFRFCWWPTLALVAAYASSRGPGYPQTALVAAAGGVFALVVSPVWRLRRGVVREQWFWVAVSSGGIAGTLVDLPVPLSSHTLSYAFYSACLFAALDVLLSERAGDRGHRWGVSHPR